MEKLPITTQPDGTAADTRLMTWLHDAAARAGALPATVQTDDSPPTVTSRTKGEPSTRPTDMVETANDDGTIATADTGAKAPSRPAKADADETGRLHRVAVAPSEPPNPMAPISKEQSARVAQGAKVVELGARASERANGEDPYAEGTSYSRQRVPADPRVRYPYGSNNACNVFAGDAGTVGGLQMPVHPAGGGGRGTYMNAGNLPHHDGFARVSDRDDIREGDLLARYGGRGPMESHIEVVTRVQRDSAGAVTRVYSTGARGDGVRTGPEYGDRMRTGSPDGNAGFADGADTYYILRPRRSMLRSPTATP